MIGAALGGLSGLRQTVAGLLPGRGPMRLKGTHPPRRSTLADANGQRDPGLFFDLLMALLPCLDRTGRREMRQAVRLIDSTQIATAPIAYLLIRLAQARLVIAHQASIILTVVRGQLFTRKTLAHLLDPPPIRRSELNPQFALFPCRAR
jgi:hypothetical protein